MQIGAWCRFEYDMKFIHSWSCCSVLYCCSRMSLLRTRLPSLQCSAGTLRQVFHLRPSQLSCRHALTVVCGAWVSSYSHRGVAAVNVLLFAPNTMGEQNLAEKNDRIKGIHISPLGFDEALLVALYLQRDKMARVYMLSMKRMLADWICYSYLYMKLGSQNDVTIMIFSTQSKYLSRSYNYSLSE